MYPVVNSIILQFLKQALVGYSVEALAKSKKSTSTCLWLSILLANSSIMVSSWVVHECPDLNPCWKELSMLFFSRCDIIEW